MIWFKRIVGILMLLGLLGSLSSGAVPSAGGTAYVVGVIIGRLLALCGAILLLVSAQRDVRCSREEKGQQ